MRLLHERWRTRTSLLAAGCLDGPEHEATLRHLDACAECRKEHAESVALLAALAGDPAHAAEPPLPVQFLASRVEARLDALVRARGWRWSWAAAGLAVAALVVAVVPRLVAPVARSSAPAGSAAPASAPSAETVAMSDETLRRLERNVAREQAARYLDAAQDVLVTMAAAQRPCERGEGRVDVGAEARRSRELLERQALLVELSGDDVMSARPVLDDVEQVLREVAALESCVKAGDVARVQREMERRRLLMKIRLMSRELQG